MYVHCKCYPTVFTFECVHTNQSILTYGGVFLLVCHCYTCHNRFDPMTTHTVLECLMFLFMHHIITQCYVRPFNTCTFTNPLVFTLPVWGALSEARPNTRVVSLHTHPLDHPHICDMTVTLTLLISPLLIVWSVMLF